jgi:hypothetical protein
MFKITPPRRLSVAMLQIYYIILNIKLKHYLKKTTLSVVLYTIFFFVVFLDQFYFHFQLQDN